MDFCRAHRSPVDSGVGAYFYIVFNYHIADLGNLQITAVLFRGKSKAVASHNNSRMENAILADNAPLVYFNTCVKSRVVSNNNTVANIALRVYFYVLSYFGILADIRECTKIN